MKQNGFTLIELIGVVAIIALVMLVAVPSVMSTLNNSSSKESETLKHDLELAAESYVENNWNEFKNDFISKNRSQNYCLSLKTLKDKNYIKSTDKDPTTKAPIDVNNKYILLTNRSTTSGNYRFSFEYVDIEADSSSICNSWVE